MAQACHPSKSANVARLIKRNSDVKGERVTLRETRAGCTTSVWRALVVAPDGPGDPDKESVGAIQDLLRGQGQPSMPNRVAAGPGKWALVHGRRRRRMISYVSLASSRSGREASEWMTRKVIGRVVRKNRYGSDKT